MAKPDDLNTPGYFQRIERKLDVLLAYMYRIAQTQGVVMADLSALEAEVTQNGDAVESAVALLNGLNTQLQEALASDDPAAVQALADQLSASTDALANAVFQNTPHVDNTLPEGG